MLKRRIGVIGLGYVGLTTALAFSQKGKIIAYDINIKRIQALKTGHDHNSEVDDKKLKNKNIFFTNRFEDLKKADFYIITVPTPLDDLKLPNLSMILKVTEMIAKLLKKGDIIVYESTVYPGATEEECIPTLEKGSNLICDRDFGVGFSPERVNPGDKVHVFTNIPKIVSGHDQKALDIIANVFATVVPAGVHRAASIKVAEAAKVIENTQRDINISLMNEVAKILDKMKVDTGDVINAMKTKWNYLAFKPGLVGGHCIGINSYYLLYKAHQLGLCTELIPAARRVNESMAKFIVENTIKHLIKLGIPIKHARIAILGLTYKENCSDVRDTGVIGIINELKSYYTQVIVHDPLIDPEIAKKEYGITLEQWENLTDIDAIILAVSHRFYMELNPKVIIEKLNHRGLIVDIKEVFSPQDFEKSGVTLWRL